MIIPSKTGITFLTGSVTGAIVGVALALIAFSTWNALIDNPRVIAEARKEYVLKSELVSLETKQALEESRRKAAESIASQYKKNLGEALAKNEADQVKQELEISEYEARLKTAGRVCFLNSSDIEWLKK